MTTRLKQLLQSFRSHIQTGNFNSDLAQWQEFVIQILERNSLDAPYHDEKEDFLAKYLPEVITSLVRLSNASPEQITSICTFFQYCGSLGQWAFAHRTPKLLPEILHLFNPKMALLQSDSARRERESYMLNRAADFVEHEFFTVMLTELPRIIYSQSREDAIPYLEFAMDVISKFLSVIPGSTQLSAIAETFVVQLSSFIDHHRGDITTIPNFVVSVLPLAVQCERTDLYRTILSYSYKLMISGDLASQSASRWVFQAFSRVSPKMKKFMIDFFWEQHFIAELISGRARSAHLVDFFTPYALGSLANSTKRVNSLLEIWRAIGGRTQFREATSIQFSKSSDLRDYRSDGWFLRLENLLLS
jgi:hypothetical protein